MYFVGKLIELEKIMNEVTQISKTNPTCPLIGESTLNFN